MVPQLGRGTRLHVADVDRLELLVQVDGFDLGAEGGEEDWVGGDLVGLGAEGGGVVVVQVGPGEELGVVASLDGPRVLGERHGVAELLAAGAGFFSVQLAAVPESTFPGFGCGALLLACYYRPVSGFAGGCQRRPEPVPALSEDVHFLHSDTAPRAV